MIARHFAAAEAGDIDSLVDCFTDDAWVLDEDRRHEGRAAIRAWREHAASAYTYTLDIRGATETGPDEYRVDTHLEGDFPGGVVDLSHVFALRGELIAGLQI